MNPFGKSRRRRWPRPLLEPALSPAKESLNATIAEALASLYSIEGTGDPGATPPQRIVVRREGKLWAAHHRCSRRNSAGLVGVTWDHAMQWADEHPQWCRP